MSEGVGDRFHKETKYHPDRMPGGSLDFSIKPDTYKEYTGCRKIKLSGFRSVESTSLFEALKSRRSVRRFSQEPISIEDLSYLLWASSGIARNEGGRDFRTAPSAGALYPIETYIMANNVKGLEEGVYHYSIKEHLLEELRLGDLKTDITLAALGQKMCRESAVVFVWTAIFYRSKWKYKQRAYRYIYLDCGHIAENLALASCSLGLGSCQIGALFDDEVNRILNVDGTEESVIYMSVVGHPLY
ncbi:MAG: SagB/ThcOx family dehydrogenase [Halobacteriota archaeon]|nr:SagB/ThcOx family dehydrogenase [Halobacteriota archaeon]